LKIEDDLIVKKTLGIAWEETTDQFYFNTSVDLGSCKLTKRVILSLVARLFDPLGFLSPYLIIGKILIQKLWKSGYDWDTEVDLDVQKEFQTWIGEMEKLKLIRIDRFSGFTNKASNISLHAFSDASGKAYGAVIYIVTETDAGFVSKMLISKSRVCPLVAVTIPRLELMAASISVELASRICSVLELPLSCVYFWTDSQIVLHWVRGNISNRYKPFVANRIAQILHCSSPQQWFYVASKMNPADMISRGISAGKLIKNSLWWEGPPMLQEKIVKEEIEKEIETEQVEESAELKKCYLFNVVQSESPFVDFHKFSNYKCLIRVWAWVNRFVFNLSRKFPKRVHIVQSTKESSNQFSPKSTEPEDR